MLHIKRVHSEKVRDAVFALRYRAYRHENAIPESATERFEDKYDAQPNQILWALTEHNKVIGSIRTNWYEPRDSWAIPEMDAYGEDIAKAFPVGSRLLSGNRFVTDPDRNDRNHHYALLLLRHHMLIAPQRAEYALAAVREHHISFYSRILKLLRISEKRVYPGLNSEMYLTASHIKNNIYDVYSNTPELQLHGYERLFIDEAYRDVWEIGLPVEF